MKSVAVILKTVVIAVGCVTGLSITLQAEIITQSTSFQIVDLGAGVKPKAIDINNSSSFVGIATINGVEHSFLATLAVPEPSSLVLTAASLFLFTRFRTRKNRH